MTCLPTIKTRSLNPLPLPKLPTGVAPVVTNLCGVGMAIGAGTNWGPIDEYLGGDTPDTYDIPTLALLACWVRNVQQC